MGQIANVLDDWASGDADRSKVYKEQPGLVIRWINEGQLRYASKSELLRDVWSPTITSSGSIALPTNFLFEVPDRVKWTQFVYLRKIDYPTANLVPYWSATLWYSIWAETFYVWGPSAGTPTIPYVYKPTLVTVANIATADFDANLPTEFDHEILLYLDYRWARRIKDPSHRLLLDDFEDMVAKDGQTYRQRRDPALIMKSNI